MNGLLNLWLSAEKLIVAVEKQGLRHFVGDEARAILEPFKKAAGKSVKIKPSDCPGYDVFIQSTSHNRLIGAGGRIAVPMYIAGPLLEKAKAKADGAEDSDSDGKLPDAPFVEEEWDSKEATQLRKRFDDLLKHIPEHERGTEHYLDRMRANKVAFAKVKVVLERLFAHVNKVSSHQGDYFSFQGGYAEAVRETCIDAFVKREGDEEGGEDAEEEESGVENARGWFCFG